MKKSENDIKIEEIKIEEIKKVDNASFIEEIHKVETRNKVFKGEKEDKSTMPIRALSAYLFYVSEAVPKLKEKEGINHRLALKTVC